MTVALAPRTRAKLKPEQMARRFLTSVLSDSKPSGAFHYLNRMSQFSEITTTLSSWRSATAQAGAVAPSLPVYFNCHQSRGCQPTPPAPAPAPAPRP
jgi:hypothetical protein